MIEVGDNIPFTFTDCREAHQLYQFALTLETDTFSQDGCIGASNLDDCAW